MNNRMNLLSVEVLIVILLIVAGVYYFTGSVFAVSMIFLLLLIGAYFLGVWWGVPLEFPIQFVYDTEIGPEPAEAEGSDNWLKPHPVNVPEVFHVAGNKYEYKDAANVCAVYDAQLATYDQVMEAHAKGAEWCEYGWSQGSMALYPTQQTTWETLQQDDDTQVRKSCGRPGVNGGYFDKKTRFGVNCFGIKPGCNNRKYPISVGSNATDQAAIDALKKDMAHIKVWPFSNMGWSEWGM